MPKKKPPAPEPLIEKPPGVSEPAPLSNIPEPSRAAINLTDKILEKAVEDPLTTMANIDTVITFVHKVLPTLPGEAPLPIPRGLYDKMKEGGLPWQQQPKK